MLTEFITIYEYLSTRSYLLNLSFPLKRFTDEVFRQFSAVIQTVYSNSFSFPKCLTLFFACCAAVLSPQGRVDTKIISNWSTRSIFTWFGLWRKQRKQSVRNLKKISQKFHKGHCKLANFQKICTDTIL